MVAAAARNHPGQAAVIYGDQVLSWAELGARVEGAAGGLGRLGLHRGDRLAILGALVPGSLVAFLAALRAGACAVPLSTMGTAAATARALADADVRLLAVAESSRALAAELALAACPPLVALDFEAAGFASLEGAGAPEPVANEPEQPFNIIYSSGTTGVPKGIVHSHRMRSFQVERMAAFGFGPGTVTLLSTPLCSNTTLVALLPALALGGTVVLMPRFDARGFLELSQRHGVSHAMLVPAQYRRLLACPGFEDLDLGSYRVKFSTAARLPPALKAEILVRWPGRLVEIYGQTEGGCTTLLDASAHPDKLHTVGLPAEGVEIRLLDPQGRSLPGGGDQPGEIAGRAVSMMIGYHGRPDLTEALSWYDERGRRFYRTGDLGRLDADGFLELVGRGGERIVSGGFNVYASDLEAALLGHPAVADAAVIGVASERWGESPLGLVVLRQPGAITAEELLAWVNQRLGKVQRLVALELRDALPRDELGKLRRRLLRGD